MLILTQSTGPPTASHSVCENSQTPWHRPAFLANKGILYIKWKPGFKANGNILKGWIHWDANSALMKQFLLAPTYSVGTAGNSVLHGNFHFHGWFLSFLLSQMTDWHREVKPRPLIKSFHQQIHFLLLQITSNFRNKINRSPDSSEGALESDSRARCIRSPSVRGVLCACFILGLLLVCGEQ